MIPSIAHFIWFGAQFPWVNALAIRSLASRGGFQRILLHHADDLSGSPWWPELLNLKNFTPLRLDPEATLLATGPLGPNLVALYRRLSQPAARANMIRAALLATHGGVYLDLDTVTLDALTPLREEAAVFCGEEHLALPGAVTRSRSPVVLAKAGIKLALRDVFRRAPQGHKAFRKVEHRYPTAVNNAVIGARPGHPIILDLLQRMVTMDPDRQLVRYALGTHLLQEVVAARRDDPELKIHPPGVFYPLSPEISEHWFRMGDKPRLFEILRAETRVVHWYASVRTRDLTPRIDPDYVRKHAHEQPFSALALPFLG